MRLREMGGDRSPVRATRQRARCACDSSKSAGLSRPFTSLQNHERAALNASKGDHQIDPGWSDFCRWLRLSLRWDGKVPNRVPAQAAVPVLPRSRGLLQPVLPSLYGDPLHPVRDRAYDDRQHA